jgi:hypothetical protein
MGSAALAGREVEKFDKILNLLRDYYYSLWPATIAPTSSAVTDLKQETEDTKCGPRLKLVGSLDMTTAIIL